MERLRVEDVQIGKRYRKDNGDLTELKASIEKRGLINPITIRRGSNLLLAGGRRFECLKQLGVEELVEGEHFRFFDDLENPVAVEFDENVIRKDFLPSEKTEIALAMEALERPRAEERQNTGYLKAAMNSSADTMDEPEYASYENEPGGRESEDLPGDGEDFQILAKAEPTERERAPRTTDKVATAVGWSRKTLEKAKEVYTAAKENPDKFGHLIEEMDEGSVETAHQKLSTIKAQENKKKYGLCDEVVRMKTNELLEVPRFFHRALAYIPKSKQRQLVEKYGETLYRVKQTDFDRAIKNYSKGNGVLSLDENELLIALTDVLEGTKRSYEEWPLMPAVRAIYYQLDSCLKNRSSKVTTLDKIELITISMSIILAYGNLLFQKAMSEKLFETLPIMKKELFYNLLTNLEAVYGMPDEDGEAGVDGRASLPIALKWKERAEEFGEDAPGMDIDRLRINAFNAHERIEEDLDEFVYVKKVLSKTLSGINRAYSERMRGHIEDDELDGASVG